MGRSASQSKEGKCTEKLTSCLYSTRYCAGLPDLMEAVLTVEPHTQNESLMGPTITKVEHMKPCSGHEGTGKQ